jgi:hypothetical protein
VGETDCHEIILEASKVPQTHRMHRQIEIFAEFLHNSNVGEVGVKLRVLSQDHDNLLASSSVRQMREHVDIKLSFLVDFLILVSTLQRCHQNFDLLEDFRIVEAENDVAEAFRGIVVAFRQFLEFVFGEETGRKRKLKM